MHAYHFFYNIETFECVLIIVHSKIWQSDTSKFFLDHGEFIVYIFSMSGKQATSNCSLNLNVKPTTNENCSRLKRFSVEI